MPATITPFDAEERINADALRTLMAWNQSQGADSFFIGGRSAECFLLLGEPGAVGHAESGSLLISAKSA